MKKNKVGEEDGLSVYEEESYYEEVREKEGKEVECKVAEEITHSHSFEDSKEICLQSQQLEAKEFTNILTDEEYLNMMDSIGVELPYDLPENHGLSEEEARKIINSWFDSSPERKSMKGNRRSKIVQALSTKYAKAYTIKKQTMKYEIKIDDGVLSSAK